MKKLLLLASLAALPSLASASCTFTENGQFGGKVVCTTVAETAIAFTSAATLGWSVNACTKGIVVVACNDGSNALTAAATLSMYVYDSAIGGWMKYPDQDITTATITAAQKCQVFDGKWTVVPADRIAFLPTAGTLAGGNFTIWLRCN